MERGRSLFSGINDPDEAPFHGRNVHDFRIERAPYSKAFCFEETRERGTSDTIVGTESRSNGEAQDSRSRIVGSWHAISDFLSRAARKCQSIQDARLTFHFGGEERRRGNIQQWIRTLLWCFIGRH